MATTNQKTKTLSQASRYISIKDFIAKTTLSLFSAVDQTIFKKVSITIDTTLKSSNSQSVRFTISKFGHDSNQASIIIVKRFKVEV